MGRFLRVITAKTGFFQTENEIVLLATITVMERAVTCFTHFKTVFFKIPQRKLK